jgi:hypothetical protein
MAFRLSPALTHKCTPDLHMKQSGSFSLKLANWRWAQSQPQRRYWPLPHLLENMQGLRYINYSVASTIGR